MSSVPAASVVAEMVDASAAAAASASARIAEEMSGVGGALTMSIIAFSVVFLVLGGLSGVIYAIKYMAQGLERKKSAPPSGGSAPAPSAPASVSASSAPVTGADGRLMAVLAAAVAASGIAGRIVGVSAAGGSRTRPERSAGWRSAALAEGIRSHSRDWK